MSEEIKPQQEHDKKLIETRLLRKDGDMILYIKTAREFEDYLKKNRKTAKTDNFCNTDLKKEFYDGRLNNSESAEYDSATRDIIVYNRINNAVLRIKGISDGVELKINRLLAIEELESMIKKFCLDFKHFYREFLKNFEVNISITYKGV